MTANADPRLIADRLTAAAERVRTLPISDGVTAVNLSWTSYGETVDIDVHSCSPGQLVHITAAYPDSQRNVDADGILRTVVLAEDGFDITFYRR